MTSSVQRAVRAGKRELNKNHRDGQLGLVRSYSRFAAVAEDEATGRRRDSRSRARTSAIGTRLRDPGDEACLEGGRSRYLAECWQVPLVQEAIREGWFQS